MERSDNFVGDDGARAVQSAVAGQLAGAGEESGTDQYAASLARDVDRHFDGDAGFQEETSPPAATRAAPIRPAWFCNWAGTTGTLTMP